MKEIKYQKWTLIRIIIYLLFISYYFNLQNTEIHDRLNAIGRDISILVQPYDLVKQLKKQLKSLPDYKEYIVM